MAQTFSIEGIPVDCMSQEEAVRAICAAVDQGKGAFAVHTINLDHVVKLRRDGRFRSAYEKARFVLADGFPIVWAGRLQGLDVSRTTGSDLIEPLCREAAKRNQPVVFYGSVFPSLAGAAKELKRRIPDLEIAGVYAPGMLDVNSAEPPEGMDYLRGCGAKICFVALGAPKQELISERLTSEFDGTTAMLCIGAGLDFIAGKEQRAPAAFQKAGLEWLWRWSSAPGRMTGRYIDCFRVLPSVLLSGLSQKAKGQTEAG